MNANEVYQYMFRTVADVISQNANRNTVRNEYAVVMSNNNWMNQQYEQLVQDAVAFLNMVADRYPQNTSVEDIFYDVADRWVEMDVAAFALAVPELNRQLDQQAFNEAGGLKRERDNFLQAMYPSQRTALGQPVQQLANQSGGVLRNLSSGRPLAAAVVHGGNASNSFRAAFTGQQEPTGPAMSGGYTSVAAPKPAIQPVPMPAQVQSPAVQNLTSTTPSQPFQAPTIRGRHVAPVETVDGPDFTKARPYDEFTQDGEVWRLAHKSNWKLDDDEQRFPVLYDPTLYVAFHVLSKSGKVRQEILEMNRDNDYARHELSSKATLPIPAEKPVYKSDGKIAHDAPGRVQRATAVEKALRKDPVYLDMINAVSTMAEGELLINHEVVNSGEDATVVGMYAVAVPLIVSKDVKDQVKGISEATNLTDVSERMRELKNSGAFGAFTFLNKRFCEAVNNQLTIFGVKGSIDDIANDYQDVIDYLKSSRGEAWTRSFSQKTRSVISYVANVQDDETEYLTEQVGLPADAPYLPEVVVYRDYYGVAHLPINATDLGLNLTFELQELDPETHSHLYEFIEGFREHVVDKVEQTTIYLLTKDQVRVEVVRSVEDNDTYLLRLMQ